MTEPQVPGAMGDRPVPNPSAINKMIFFTAVVRLKVLKINTAVSP